MRKIMQIIKSQIKQPKKTNIDFVIFGAMRSGSNLLQEKLNYFEDIICLGELYNPSFVGVDRPHINSYEYAGYSRNDKESRKNRQDDPFLLLEKVTDEAHKENKFIGFRVFDEHNKFIRRTLINDTRVKKIILHRNLVDSYISLELARQTGQWVKRDNKNSEIKTIHFDINDFEKYTLKMKSFFNNVIKRLNDTGQEYLVVDYNDVLDNNKIKKLAEFIGTNKDFTQKETKLKKQNSATKEDIISNYTEVKEYIENFNTTAIS